MADVITRLRVESSEYDSKIKRASQGLLQMEQACRKVGGTLAILEKDELEFVKGLGKMETVSKDARGQLNELTKAFTDLSLQYKRLTDEEKQGDFGKALASSLGELKTRIQDTKGQLNEINGEINGGGGLTGALDQLAGKFGLNIQQLAGWGAALGAAKVAIDVSRDAFFQSESNIDEWGRTVEGANGAYNTFLDTINSGNWSEFFSNMSMAVQGARDLYDALDRLGSIKSNNAAAIAIVQQQIAQLRLAKQQGENVDEQIKAATAKLADLQGQSVSAGKSAGTLSIGNIIRSAYDTHGTGGKISDRNINNVVNELLQDGQNAFDKYAKVYQRLEEKASDTRKVTVGTSITGASISATERYTNLDKLTEEERKQYTLSKAITEAETRIQKGISIYAQAVSEGTANAREEFKGNRYALTGSGGSGGGKSGGGSATTVAKELSPMQQAQKEISALTEEALTADEARLEVIKKEIAALQEQVNVYKSIQDFVQGKEPNWNIQVGDRKAFEAEQKKRFEAEAGTPSRLQSMEYSVMKEIKAENIKVDTETLHTLLKDALQNSIDTISLNLEPLAEQIGEGVNVPDEKWQEILDKYNELRAQIGEEPIQIDFNTGKSKNSGDKSKNNGSDTGLSIMNKMSGGISSIAGSIEQLGIKLPDGLHAVLSGIQGIASILSGISAIVSAIEVMTTVSSLPFFARGGIVHAAGGLLVPGHDYSDSTPVMVSSGELILNKAQQNTIASLLQEGNAASVSSTPYVCGEQIYLGLTNYLIRSGRGELLTARG